MSNRYHGGYPAPRGYHPGDYKVICDLTGMEALRSECVMRWDGLLVLRSANEARHPQDFLRSKRDDQRVPLARPELPDRFAPAQTAWDDLPHATGNR